MKTLCLRVETRVINVLGMAARAKQIQTSQLIRNILSDWYKAYAPDTMKYVEKELSDRQYQALKSALPVVADLDTMTEPVEEATILGPETEPTEVEIEMTLAEILKM